MDQSNNFMDLMDYNGFSLGKSCEYEAMNPVPAWDRPWPLRAFGPPQHPTRIQRHPAVGFLALPDNPNMPNIYIYIYICIYIYIYVYIPLDTIGIYL